MTPHKRAQSLVAAWLDRSLPLEEWFQEPDRAWLKESLHNDIADAIRDAEARGLESSQ